MKKIISIILPLIYLSSCIPTFENVRELPAPINIQPFEEISVAFQHHWKETSHPFSGAAVVDVDNNGTFEIFIGGGEGQQDALLSFQQGKLVDIIENTGLSSEVATYGVTSIDIDNDRDTDLLIARNDGVYLYLNNLGVFQKKKIPLHFQKDEVPFGVAVSDINNDGYGDLYISVFIEIGAFKSVTFNDADHAKKNIMLLNNGDLTFTDITDFSRTASKQNTFLAVFVDLDSDGWQDLVVSQNTGEIEIFRNLGTTKFQPIPTNSGYGFWMGLAV